MAVNLIEAVRRRRNTVWSPEQDPFVERHAALVGLIFGPLIFGLIFWLSA